MKKRLNKKGFTLIELMVTIVIMLSILLLAIVSVNEISDRQKEKAFEQTKNQIITAAKEYFSDNEYFINDIAISEGETAYISLGTLVKLDYINVVTNPITGEKLDPCTAVVIQNGVYSYDDSFELGNCEMGSAIVGIPELVERTEPTTTTTSYEEETTEIEKSFKVIPYQKDGSKCNSIGNTLNSGYSFNVSNKNKISGWFNNSNAANGIYLKLEDMDKNDSSNENTYSFKDNDACITSDGETKKVVVDSEGDEYTLTIKLDRTPPVISYTINSNWTNAASVGLAIELTDSVSKLNSEKRYWNETGLNKEKAESSTYKWSNSSVSYPGGSSETASSANIYGKESYSHTEYYKAEGYRTGKIKACDIAGNCAFSNEYYAKIDRGIPAVTVDLQKCDYSSSGSYTNCTTYKSGEWANKWFRAQMSSSDSLSGIELTCYATSGKTTNYVCDEGENGTVSSESKRSAAIHAQGVSYLRFAVKDKAGNWYKADTGSVLYTIKLDRTPPEIKTFTVSTRASNYNSRTATFSWEINESVSSIGVVKTNVKNKAGNKSWDRTSEGISQWKYTSTDSSYFVMSTSYNGTTVTPKLEAYDIAGNYTSKTAPAYTVYKDLVCKMVKTTKPCESDVSNLISGQVKIICNKKIKSGTATYTYNTSSSSCDANATTTYNANNNYNAVVFNFRGCGGSYVLKKAKFEVTDGINTVTKTADGFDLKSDSSVAPSCNPDRGVKNLSYE